jgi:DNA-binding CsgD family transcriptional regulator/tetratricopeptide (TPR) repeat protein
VLLGTSDTELGLPYQPWVQVLEHLLKAMPAAVAQELAADLTELAPLVPQLERLVPGLPPRAPAADPETERYRLYNAVDAVLTDTAGRWPTVVLLDDLHWAGAPTLALLRQLARSGHAERLLIVGTFRDTGDEVTEPLASCLAELRRIPTTVRLRLSGLAPGDVASFVTSAVGHELDPDLGRLASAMAQHTGGNAFYLGELWRHLVANGAVTPVAGRWIVRHAVLATDVPDSVREVVADRLGRLSAAAREAVEHAAGAGQQVDLRVLQLAVERSEHEVGNGLDDLVDAKVLMEVGGSLRTFQFVHAIVRDTVERTIAPSARARIHLRLAEALEQVYEGDRRPVLAQLARHFAEGSLISGPAKAVYYGRRAANQAMRSVAHDEAIHHLRVALSLDPPTAERVDLLLILGQALARSGQHHDAVAIHSEAFRMAADAGLVMQAAEAANGLGEAQHMQGIFAGRAVEIAAEALRLLGDTDDRPMRTRLQSTLARALALDGRQSEAMAMGEEALANARLLGRPDVLIEALRSAVIVASEPGRLLRDGVELVELARSQGDVWSQAYGLGNVVRAYLTLGEMGPAAAAKAEQRRVVDRSQVAMFGYMARVYDATFALINGRFDEAERLAEAADEYGASTQMDFRTGVYGMQMYVIRREQGRLAEVTPVLRLAVQVAEESGLWLPGLAAAFAEMGMLEEARRAFTPLAKDGFAGIARDTMWPCCLTFLAEVCVALGDRAHAEVLYREIEPHRGLNVVVGFTVCLGPAERLMGGLAALMGRRDDAERHFAAALELAERAGSRPWQARVLHDWGRALGNRPDLLVCARDIARELGMAALERSCAEVRATARATADSASLSSGATRPAPSPVALPDGLSQREVEVLRLVAGGLSNRAIGARLHISPNTAANHVRAILQKTASANRAEATAYAARNGLLG